GLRIGLASPSTSDLRLLHRIIDGKQGNEVIWQTDNGMDVLQRVRQDPPDLLLMDLSMPLMDSVQTTRQVMAQFPCAILIVSPSLGHQTQALAFDVLHAGALDVLRHPLKGEDCARVLLEKITALDAFIHATKKRAPATASHAGVANQNRSGLLAIAASTGGPAALVEVLRGLGTTIPWPIVVVQHVEQRFSRGLAEWMNQQLNIPVVTARIAGRLEAGTVYLASGHSHLVVSVRQTLDYRANDEKMPFCPSADIFFNSLVENWQGEAIGVLLTGMGRDGAQGLKAMRGHGWHTIAQDEESCKVYGMPKAAARIQAAVSILPLKSISASLRHRMSGRKHATTR
ncbi:MAG: chemotaxis-specific protein-glutamate methyltransferase CheB, partial [Mariprofundaceae bacterium]|nr:chemotaxis-specific protein-glutamate methyltransferase CheB [Mariprofundaceae bacterium]